MALVGMNVLRHWVSVLTLIPGSFTDTQGAQEQVHSGPYLIQTAIFS